MARTGGQVLIDALRQHDGDTAYCVPGESYLAALHALYEVREAIRVTTCRHEVGTP